jgi:signal transduction histidine kinase
MATDHRYREALVALGEAPTDGAPTAHALVRDVHERVTSAASAARRSTWLSTLVDQLPEAVVAWVGGREVQRNRRAVALLGAPDGAADLVDLLAALHPTDREAVTLHLSQAGREADPPPVVARLTVGPPGRWIELSSSALQTPDGPAILSVIRDVTDRRRLELESAAQNRMATVGTLAAGVAHEINNPLCFMQLNLEMLRDDLPNVLDQLAQADDAAAREQARSDLEARLEDVLTGAGRVRAVVSDLKVFSHTQSPESGVVDVVEAVRLAINLGRHQLRHRAEIELCAAGPVPVVGSLGKLSQVFLNLMVNAAQAISDAGVSDGRVRVHVVEEDDMVEVRVVDNGPGLEAGVGDRVFDPFFTSKPVGDGTGLGLSISLSIVQALGGTIAFDAPDGGGACARVRLPRAAEAADSPDISEAAEPLPARAPSLRRSILVADDEALLRKALERRLARDFDVRCVPDGARVVELLEAGATPDALLLDVMMPRLDRPGVLRWIERNRPTLRDRVVFMTGGAVTADARSFLADTPNLTFGKPLEVEAMVTQLHMLHLVHVGTRERVAVPVRYVRSRAEGEHRELGLEVRSDGAAADALGRWAAA